MKKFSRTAACSLLLLIFTMLLPFSVSASEVKQKGIASTTITIEWTAPELADGDEVIMYDVYFGKTKEVATRRDQKLPFDRTFTMTGVMKGAVRYFRVEAWIWNNAADAIELRVVGELTRAVTKPGAVTGTELLYWYYNLKRADVTWTACSQCSGYQFKLVDPTGKTVLTRTITGSNMNYLTLTNLSATKLYTFTVRAYMEFNGVKYLGPWSSPLYVFTQPRLTALKFSGSNKVFLQWNKITGVTKYYVYASESPTSGYKRLKALSPTINTAYLTKISDKEVSSKKTYYVYVVAAKDSVQTARDCCWGTKYGYSSAIYF